MFTDLVIFSEEQSPNYNFISLQIEKFGDFFIFYRPMLACRHWAGFGCNILCRCMIAPAECSSTLSTSRWFVLPVDVIARAIWQARVRVVIMTTSFAVVGVVVALLKQSEFRSEARIIPEMNTGASDLFKRLSSMARFAEVDFSDAEGVDAIRPDLYPTVLQSTPFVLFLIDQPITVKGQLATIGQFLAAGHINWPWKEWFTTSKSKSVATPANRTKEPIQLSMQQQELAEEISERVQAKLDTRSGIITITAQMPDAHVAATVAQLAMNYLTEYVRAYRTEKARLDLSFYKKQLDEARQRNQRAQLALFHYNDNHKAIAIQTATIERERMEAELDIARTVYTELSRYFEQAKLKVQERTPIFNVLEPPNVPLKRTSPKRILTVTLFALAGLVISGLNAVFRQADVVGRFRAMIAEDNYFNKLNS